MKKILIILETITLIGTSTTSLVACDIPHEYTPEELAKLKEKNKINTTNQEIKDNLEWIAPQEKPFNQVNDKWYYVIWRGYKNADLRIIKFLNNEIYIKIQVDNNFVIRKASVCSIGAGIALNKIKNGQEVGYKIWPDINYFKSVYCWNLDNNVPDLIIDNYGNIKVK